MSRDLTYSVSDTKSEKLKLGFYQALDHILQTSKLEEPSPAEVYISSSQAGSSRVKVLKVKHVRSKQATSSFHSPFDSIESARKGVLFKDFKKIYDFLDFTNSKWAEILGISERTMQSLLKDKRNLDQNKSEKLLAFLTLVEYGLDVLGSYTHFNEWMLYKSPFLKGKTPLDYVDTYQGLELLKEILFKVETGNLA